ncbi:flagellar assembly protein FliH [Thermosulfidibacter takaii ABI70S6]|uniref:Flagellar assembly protein FliH n=1 Tax=Thermosulfidibacter takaii (strain DSM 17441 / JCM 13301 / NBRC 103674 / ABI70S6) TaxID=1298851 RepID=A0A0S3QSW9_THET7|nr:FliH/SctL family protein [Thermosulfidibacter takaii]BAT71437.1 flagellar assembly protein FliH [Thermosulfidibacter takaii ABI70S6]
MRKSLRKKRVIKAEEALEKNIGSFCLIDVEVEDLKNTLGTPETNPEQDKTVEESVTKSSDPTQMVNIEELFENARKEGFNKGYKEGFEKGKSEGYQTGLKEGIESGKKDGFKKGYEKGFKAGKEEGRNIVETRYKGLLDRIQAGLQDLEKLKVDFEVGLNSLEDVVVGLVVESMKKLLFVIPEESLVRETVKELVNRVAEGQEARLVVNPKDWDIVKDNISVPSFVKVTTDVSLKRGSCIVETEAGFF